MKQLTLTNQFLSGLKESGKYPADKLDKMMRVIGSNVGEALIVGNRYGPGTPVDTGNARGHWYATIGEEDAGHPHPPVTDAKGKPVGDAEALSAAAVNDAGIIAATARMGDVVCFNNGADYIEELNNGHSQQAPNGMTDSVVQNFEQIVRDAALKVGLDAS